MTDFSYNRWLEQAPHHWNHDLLLGLIEIFINDNNLHDKLNNWLSDIQHEQMKELEEDETL